MTTSADIFDAMSSWLENEQTFSPALRIAAQRVKFDPGPDETYLMTQFLPGETSNFAVGAGKDFHSGIFQVSVVFPEKGQGMLAPIEIADEVIRLFKKGTIIPTAEGRRVEIIRNGWQAPLLPDPTWPMIPVSIPYTLVEPN